MKPSGRPFHYIRGSFRYIWDSRGVLILAQVHIHARCRDWILWSCFVLLSYCGWILTENVSVSVCLGHICSNDFFLRFVRFLLDRSDGQASSLPVCVRHECGGVTVGDGPGDFAAAFFDIFGSKWCSSSQKDADVPPSCIRMFKEYVWNSKMTVLIRPSNPFTRGASQGFQETQFWQLKAKSKPKDFKIRSTTIPKNYFERSWMFIFGPKSTQITTQSITLGSSPKCQNSSKGRVVEIVTVIFSTWWFGANHRLGKQFPGRPKCPKIVFRYP